MRALVDIFAIVVGGFGLISLIIAFLFPSGFNGTAFVIGIVLLIIGVVISRSASGKICPQCAERVKYEARKCKHCGTDLAPAGR